MLALRLTFLSGRFHATPWGHHVNEGVIEWPPSPWRLLRALVAAWKRGAPDLDTGTMSALLRALSDPPEFLLPPATVAHTRHFMPSPVRRDKIFDTFVVVHRDTPLWIMWPNVEVDDAGRECLQRVARSLPYLGRAESTCELVVNGPRAPDRHGGGLVSRPSREGEEHSGDELVHLLCAEPWSETETVAPGHPLLVDTTFLRTVLKRIDPPGSRWVPYYRPAVALHPGTAPRTGARPERPTVARYVLDGWPLPRITEAVRVAEQFRQRLLQGRIAEDLPLLSGKTADGPARGHRHAMYLSTSRNRDRRVDRITVVARGGFGDEERRALERISVIAEGKGRAELRAVLLGLTAFEDERLRELFGPSTAWRSLTPYVPSRYPRPGHDGFLEQVRRDAAQMGLPHIQDIEPFAPRGRGQPRWQEFRRWRDVGPGPPIARGWGLKIRFAEVPPAGPVCFGYGAHFGLGLFEPEVM